MPSNRCALGELEAVLNNIIKSAFALVGAVTGFTLTHTFLAVEKMNISDNIKVTVTIVISGAFAVIFFSTANKIIEIILEVLDRIENAIQNMTLYELAVSACGLIAGLIIANLITIPVNKLDIIGVPISITVNIIFGCAGIAIALGKKNDVLFESIREKSQTDSKKEVQPKILDTSVIIDGRIVDICRAGFMEGELVVPAFVLEELRRIADSSDSLKRNRGRRGLDILNMLQKELEHPIRVENIETEQGTEVDEKLLQAAKRFNGIIVTTDYNLAKVASVQGIKVLNINELANAVKPIALPGEEMVVQVIKDGKENGQGIGYLDDGTMIVVDGGRRHMGESICVMVTSVLQTTAGRMIFAKPKYSAERVM